MWICMTRIAGHAARHIGFCFLRSMAGQTSLRKRIQLLFEGNRARAVLVEYGYYLGSDIRNKAVASFKVLLGKQLMARGVSPCG